MRNQPCNVRLISVRLFGFTCIQRLLQTVRNRIDNEILFLRFIGVVCTEYRIFPLESKLLFATYPSPLIKHDKWLWYVYGSRMITRQICQSLKQLPIPFIHWNHWQKRTTAIRPTVQREGLLAMLMRFDGTVWVYMWMPLLHFKFFQTTIAMQIRAEPILMQWCRLNISRWSRPIYKWIQ